MQASKHLSCAMHLFLAGKPDARYPHPRMFKQRRGTRECQDHLRRWSFDQWQNIVAAGLGIKGLFMPPRQASGLRRRLVPAQRKWEEFDLFFLWEWTTCASWWRWLSFLCTVLFSDDRTWCRDRVEKGDGVEISFREMNYREPAAEREWTWSSFSSFSPSLSLFFTLFPELFWFSCLSKHEFGYSDLYIFFFLCQWSFVISSW